ncbi:MAG: NADH-quinone oxidoreductase subunit G [Micavibrio sp.]|nr:NADH-quinone oxidoreductase subunit G [Micavibrio sp.]|tara:strand:- start:404437 stop:406479 length:2043 start_codon:yes stop_codon:yes gene_type:complete
MPKLKINGQDIEVEAGTSILQAAELAGFEVPRFCYHDRLSVPANCRMCLVEVKGAPKPVASCALAAGEGMEVDTQSDLVKKARKGVMEMLLINHPLDCPICDQGGECDLQDQAMGYGFDRSRYRENKRAVKNKNIGPLIKTIMTRCIHCTRCVRFGEEVAGTAELGLLNRGEDVEIGTFIEKAVSTELSGNMIDICPVGALTSRPYAYKARPWELKKTMTIDAHDAVGCNIRVDARGNEVMRVLPRLNEAVNEEWINDRTRFAYDGLKRSRLDRPYIRNAKTKALEPASWDEALKAVAEKLKDVNPKTTLGLVGSMCAVEDVVSFKDALNVFGITNMRGVNNLSYLTREKRTHYKLNTTIAGLEKADVILLVGTNPRHEATLVNTRILKAVSENGARVGVVGAQNDLTYDYDYLGQTLADIEKVIGGQSDFAKSFKKAERPAIVIGANVLDGKSGEPLYNLCMKLANKMNVVREGWNGFNVLHRHASQMAVQDFELTSKVALEKAELVFALGYDEADFEDVSKKAFVIYQGHHGDLGAHRADIILPGAAYTEKDGLYVNTEGRVQIAKRAVFPVGEAKEDWRIFRALSAHADEALDYDTMLELRTRIFEDMPAYASIDYLLQENWVSDYDKKAKVNLKSKVSTPDEAFYLANPICRASETMQQCHAAFVEGNTDLKEVAE